MKKFSFNIKMTVKSFVGHPLFSGSLVMVVGTNLANFVAYLYHLIIGRLLGPVPYGELASSIATLGLFSTAFSFLGIVIVKFVSASKKKELAGLFNWFFKKGLIFASLLFVFQLILSPFFSNFLKIDMKTTLLFAPILFLMFFSFMIRAFLQGLLRFGRAVVVTNLDLMARLILGLLFIFWGYSSFGGVLGILLASFFGVILGFLFLRDVKPKTKVVGYKNAGKIFVYSLPVFFISLASNSFISSDVIMAKHYLSTTDAGIYAALSTLGKIIFYSTAPISAVAFPIISKRYSQKKPYIGILSLSASMIGLLGFSIFLVYLLFPELMLKILFGEKFLMGSKYLIYFAIFALIFTFANLLVSFYLSIEKTFVWKIVIFSALLQLIGIAGWHADIKQIITITSLSTALLLFILILYFGYEGRKNK